MSFTLVRQHLLRSRRAMALSQGAPVRSYMPVAGPPRFPMSTAQRLILGVGPLIVMMIIPYWALFSIPRWSRMHQGLPLEEEEEEEAAPEPKENKEDKENKDNKETK